MKPFAVAVLAALAFCGSAQAKSDIAIRPSDDTPAVDQRVAFVVRAGRPLTHNLRLIAISPGQPVFRVVATITGDTSSPDPNALRVHGKP